MKQQRGLGRGLDLLFEKDKREAKSTPTSELSEIALDKISPNPTQPRRSFDEEQIEVLAASIKELGLIQPITLRSDKSGVYTIISGERRWRAAQIAELKTIPAYVREVDDETMYTMALVENLQRENLNPIEIAFGLQRLIEECELTQEAVAQRVSMKRSSISNYLRLLKLSDEVQYALKRSLITMGHAKAIASVEREWQRVELLKLCVERSISVREAEMRAQQFNQLEEKPKRSEVESVPVGFEGLSTRLGEIFTKGTQIKTNSRGGGRIVINFSSRSEIEQFIKELESER